ncbi:DUF4163 domain-containing protein [Aquimarina gracilis]|uniref:DUF4163 domain-containing protein n=1 Tax=Aquimarina gracilis TaxID=874422 RepID=A0ABU5ZZL2_9FLAO|nr:DUF4163 domain-containing protein [Aquimarina gracilis]MEB3347255.1 DUF4163 domain-containing protein [Aquimarina gracilis]
MINTKTNTGLKLFFFFGILLVIKACNTEESFTFEKQNVAVEKLLDCKDDDCASLDINLLKIIDDKPVCKKINTEIEKVACAILNVGENKPQETVKAAVVEFNESYKDMRVEFPDEIPPYEVSITSELSFQCKSMVSVIMDSYVFTGGAHGYGGISFINIETKTGKRIPNKDLFKRYSDFITYAEKVFRSKFEILENESINSTGFFFEDEKFSLPENIGFTNTEVILYYNPYEISSYAEGPVEIKIKKEDVASYFAFDIL